MSAVPTKRRRSKKDDRRHFALTVEQVTDEWNRRHGTTYSSAWVGLILKRAEEKIARGLRRAGVGLEGM